MDSYDYMKSLLPVPSHSVSLHPMSGGGSESLPTIPEGNDETKNIDNTNIELNAAATNNSTQFAEGHENVFGIFDFSKNNITPSLATEKEISIKEFNIGGDIYYIIDADVPTKINLADEKVRTLVKDFHLDLLDEVKQKEFIYSLLKCSDLNSIVQGPVCDPLIENISYLITKINEQYSGVVEAKATSPSKAIRAETKEYVNEIGTVEIRKFKNLCNVEGDGWCLYRSLLLAKHLLDTDSDDCETDAAKKIKNGNDDTIRSEIERIAQYIRTEIMNKTAIGEHFAHTINSVISSPVAEEDIDADYYKHWNVKNATDYLNVMSTVNDKNEKFYGDAQIAGIAFSLMNSVALNVYEDSYKIKESMDLSGKRTIIRGSLNPEYYRKSMVSSDLFTKLGLTVPKNTLHIYHSDRIHFKVLVTKRTLNARNNKKNVPVSLAPTEPPQFPSNLLNALTTQGTSGNAFRPLNIGLNKSVTEFKNINGGSI
jgi:hypothetical protein